MITSKISSTQQSKILQRKNFKEIIVNTNDINIDTQRNLAKNLISVQSSQFNNSQNDVDDKNNKVEFNNSQNKTKKEQNYILFNPPTSQQRGFRNTSSPLSPIKNAFQTQIIQENLSHIITQSMLKTIRANKFPKHDDLNITSFNINQQLIYTLNKPSKGQRDILFLNDKINLQQHFFEFVSIQEKNIQYFYDTIEYHFIPKGKSLFELGQPADSMFLILEGEAYYLIKSLGYSWNQLKDANILGKFLNLNIAKVLKKYNFIGDYDLLKKQKRQGTCIAKTDCHTVRISKQLFDSFSKKRLEQYYYFMNKFLINSQVIIEIKKSQLFNILSCFSFTEYKANQCIYQKDSNDNLLYILVSGQVELSREEELGQDDEQVIQYSYPVKEQQYFGEEAIFNLEKQYNSTSLQDSTLVIKIDKNKIENLIQESIPVFHQRLKFYSVVNREQNQNGQKHQSKIYNQQVNQSKNQQFNFLNLNQLQRPFSSMGDYSAFQSARSINSSHGLSRNLRSISQCQERDVFNTHRASTFATNNNQNKNDSKQETSMQMRSSVDSQNKDNERHRLLNLRTIQDQNSKENNPQNNERRFSIQLEDLGQFDDKDIKEDFENSSLFQMYQLKKKKLFQRANNFTIQNNLNEFQDCFSQDYRLYNSIDVTLKHKIKQFQSLFGPSPQKNRILLKQKKSPIKNQYNFEQNHQKKFLSLSYDESVNKDQEFYLQPLNTLQQNQQKVNGLSPKNGQTLSQSINNSIQNSSRNRSIHTKNPIYCTIYKEKLQSQNNLNYFRNLKIDLKNQQPQLSYQILSKICQ